MSTSSNSPLSASVEFIKDIDLYKEEKPYTYITQDPDTGFDAEFTNIKTQWVENVVVHDIRNYNTELSIDVDSFKYLTHDTLLGTRFDEEGFNEDIREMTAVIQKQLQAEKAIKFDFRIREPSAVIGQPRKRASETRSTPTGPATLVHTDHTRDEGIRFVREKLDPYEREKYLSGEYYYRIINLWKPLIDGLEDNPLGLLDPRTVMSSDIFTADNITNSWEGEVYLIKHNPEQRWWYLSRQRLNELWLFVAFDSRMETQLNFCPHATFMNTSAPANAIPRRSVEMRVIVFNRLDTQ